MHTSNYLLMPYKHGNFHDLIITLYESMISYNLLKLVCDVRKSGTLWTIDVKQVCL